MAVEKAHNFFQSLIKVVVIDTILFIIQLLDNLSEYFLSDKEKLFREKRKQPLAKRTNPNDPSSAYLTCEEGGKLRILDPNANIFDEFET